MNSKTLFDMRIHYSLCVFCLLVSVGCGDGFFSLRNEVDISDLDYKEKTSAMIIVSPESKKQLAQVFRVVPISNYPKSFIKRAPDDYSTIFNDYLIQNATFTLWDMAAPSKKVSFTENAKGYWLDYADLPIKEGHEYALRAELPNGKTFTTQTKVPENVKELTLNDMFEAGGDQNGTFDCFARISYIDPERERNFYIYEVNLIQRETIEPPTDDLNFDNISIKSYVDETSALNVRTDAFKDGQRIEEELYIDCTIFYNAVSFLKPAPSDDDDDPRFDNAKRYAYVEINVLSVTEDYYRYYEYLKGDGGGPFFEPSTFPSNIEEEHTVGIMAGYRISRHMEPIDSYIPDRYWNDPFPLPQ